MNSHPKSHTHYQAAQAKTWQKVCLYNPTTKTTHKLTDEEEPRAEKNGFAKKLNQWLIEHSTSHQTLWYVYSLVLRDPLLRETANCYRLFYDDSVKIELTA